MRGWGSGAGPAKTDGNLLCLQKFSRNEDLMSECITMLKLDIFLSCFGTATFKVVTFFTQRFFFFFFFFFYRIVLWPFCLLAG